jgi:hypothetical protein
MMLEREFRTIQIHTLGFCNNFENVILEKMILKRFWCNINTELTIHALDQVHCWDIYFRLRIGHYENFTPLNFQPLLFSKQ